MPFPSCLFPLRFCTGSDSAGSAQPRSGGAARVAARALAASPTLRFTGRRLVTVRTDGEDERHEEIVTRDGPRMRIEFPSGTAFKGQVIVEDAKGAAPLPARLERGPHPGPPPRGGAQAVARAREDRLDHGGAGRARSRGSRRSRSRCATRRATCSSGWRSSRTSGMILRRRVYDATGARGRRLRVHDGRPQSRPLRRLAFPHRAQGGRRPRRLGTPCAASPSGTASCRSAFRLRPAFDWTRSRFDGFPKVR